MIVTGGSRGIGAAIARLAGAHGYAVVVNYASDTGAAQDVVAEIRGSGGSAIDVKADVSREADVARLFETADTEFGAVTALVNNAGISGGFARVDQVSEKMLSRVFAVNVTGAFLCAREAVRRMSSEQGGRGGSIVTISSRAAQIGGGGEWVHYAATKGALDTFTIGLSREVALEGIRVNAVAAGLIATGMHAAAGSPDRTVRLAPGIPMRRAGKPEEVAEAVLWLVSPAASYVTGAIVAVAGGR
ncbi:MAG: SDR family oxidoreductase [Acidobacteriota bacterium]|nr:SDR family oxidoreductase [Acidobacteriota bacterium]